MKKEYEKLEDMMVALALGLLIAFVSLIALIAVYAWLPYSLLFVVAAAVLARVIYKWVIPWIG